MVEHLPEFVDPFALAEKGRQFKGTLPLSKMARMQDLLLDGDGVASFALRFGKDGRIAVVTGRVEAQLKLQCQCCLGEILWPVDCEVSLGLVKSLAEADLLPESYEPLLLEEDTLALADIIQEELLLAVPAIPQHAHCDSASPGAKPGQADVQAPPQRPNPFAVLAKLKH
jgi:uncharacterized protein